MKRTGHIGGTAGGNTRECTWICAVVLLNVLVAGGYSSAVGPQSADDAKPAPSGDAATAVPPRTDGETAGTPATKSPAEKVIKDLPRLLDLGAGKCIPCKMMAPILEELKGEYAGVFDVAFIDVWQHPEEADKYGVETIPTQIFFDSTGKKLYRHVGFLSKEEILGVWKAFGVERTER